MSSGKWRPFCLGLNVLNLKSSADVTAGDSMRRDSVTGMDDDGYLQPCTDRGAPMDGTGYLQPGLTNKQADMDCADSERSEK